MHLGAGALVSVLVLYFSITGALLAYERPTIQAWSCRLIVCGGGGGNDPRPPGLKPRICKSSVSAGLKTRFPGLKVRGWHPFNRVLFRDL